VTPEERADALHEGDCQHWQPDTDFDEDETDRPSGNECGDCIAAAIRAAVEEEREACAKVADEVRASWSFHSVAPAAADSIAKLIRERKA
jgi:hypothetical protein